MLVPLAVTKYTPGLKLKSEIFIKLSVVVVWNNRFPFASLTVITTNELERLSNITPNSPTQGFGNTTTPFSNALFGMSVGIDAVYS